MTVENRAFDRKQTDIFIGLAVIIIHDLMVQHQNTYLFIQTLFYADKYINKYILCIISIYYAANNAC